MEQLAAISNERRAWIDSKHHALRCSVELSALYHSKRARFLTLIERVCQAVAALTATAAFSQLAGPAETSKAGQWFALAAAVASILPLVFAWSSRSNTHSVLASEHKRLLTKIVAAGEELSEPQLVAFTAELRGIEATEGASLGALVVHCQNELALASGNTSSIVPLRWWHRATMQCWDWSITLPTK